jgi:hypothetical protein
VEAKEQISTPNEGGRPLLLVDVDGVISLFGVPHALGPPSTVVGAPRPSAPAAREQTRAEVQATAGATAEPAADARELGAGARAEPAPAGSLHSIDGIPHFLSSTAAAHLLALWDVYEPVWASGWEEKANEHLPALLGLPSELPFIRFSALENASRTTHAHWKLAAVAAYAGERPMAWIDDAFNHACHEWASRRSAPTLLVSTAPERGLTAKEAERLLAWAGSLRDR